MIAVVTVSLILALDVVSLAGILQTPAKVEKLDTVAVAGCLKETAANTWTLVNASDPVVSAANAPSPKEVAALPTQGKNDFHLIGVSIFNLPAHRNHAIVVKGLLIKATPISRLNVTSVTMVSETCPGAKIG
jgi:hypothetical protein